MKTKIMIFLMAFITWILLSWSYDWQHLLVGFFSALLVVFLTAGVFEGHSFKFNGFKGYMLFIFKYCPRFIWELVKANIDVAYRVMHPAMPIKPGIVKVKIGLKSDLAVTFLANSITLTPGTLTVDVDRKNGYLYVHCIYVKSQDVNEATKNIVSRFEPILKEIFE